jgi:oxygen-dependent protoporphyrinogen oxidase
MSKLYCQLSPELSQKLKDEGLTSQLYAEIKETLINYCPGLEIDEGSVVNQWIDHMLPVFYPGFIKKIVKFQQYQEHAPRNIYYCGDYLSQALVEGACQSGNHTATCKQSIGQKIKVPDPFI